MPGYLETLPFSDRDSEDDAMTWAVLMERGLRELGYRTHIATSPEEHPYCPSEAQDCAMGMDESECPGIARAHAHGYRQQEVSLAELVPARDAGDVCHVCGELVTWVDHAPPEPGGAVRCYRNVVQFPVMVDDIFPRVDR